jgi:hypothetical protein
VTRAGQTALGALLSAALVALNVAWVAAALGAPPHRPRDVLELDHRHYIAMADAWPGAATSPSAREAPFCYRVLAPALVHAASSVGVDLHLAFWTLTVVSATLFLFVLFESLLAGGWSVSLAGAGTVLAALMPGALRWYAYQYWMPDPLCLFLVALGIALSRERSVRALAIVSVLGLLTRESSLVVLVYAFVRWSRLEGVGIAMRRAAVAFGPGLLAFALLRGLIQAEAGAGLLEAAREMTAFRLRHLFDNQLYFATLGTFGVLVPLFAARLVVEAVKWREHAEDVAVIATVYASLAFANNTDRLLVYALPALIPGALAAAATLAAALRVPVAALVAGAVIVQAFVYARTPFHGVAGLSVYQPVQWAVVAVLAAFGVLCVAGARFRRP